MVGTSWYYSNKTFKIQISYYYLIIWCMISVYTMRTTITLYPPDSDLVYTNSIIFL
jgi:hypothetical protein